MSFFRGVHYLLGLFWVANDQTGHTNTELADSDGLVFGYVRYVRCQICLVFGYVKHEHFPMSDILLIISFSQYSYSSFTFVSVFDNDQCTSSSSGDKHLIYAIDVFQL